MGSGFPKPAWRIEAYAGMPASLLPYDPAAPDVADSVATHIEAWLRHRGVPRARVEHIGSTAVPGLAGKGIIDLALLYPPGEIAVARDVLSDMGFQRQSTRDPFPEERPMRVGSVLWSGQRYLLHVHVVAEDAAEAVALIRFRERLRAEPALRAAYEARKREILATGIRDAVAYAEAKAGFILSADKR